MKEQIFDGVARKLGAARSRRGLLRLLSGAALSGIVMTAGLGETAARKRKKRRNKGRKKKSQAVSPTCQDGIANGNESDVDCGGGSCPRCADNRICRVENDCISGTCVAGRCKTCTPFQLCGSDANGRCRCDGDIYTGENVCHSQPLLGGMSVRNCSDCPAGTEVCISVGPTVFNCHKRCGSV